LFGNLGKKTELVASINVFLEFMGEPNYLIDESAEIIPVIIERLRKIQNYLQYNEQQLQQDLIIANNNNLTIKNITNILKKQNDLTLQMGVEISRLNKWLIMKNKWIFLGI